MNQEELKTAIGHLQLDSTFTPIKRVTYNVERARVEGRTDLDKLIIELFNTLTILNND